MMQIDEKIIGIDKDLKEIWCFSSEHVCRKLGNPRQRGGRKRGEDDKGAIVAFGLRELGRMMMSSDAKVLCIFHGARSKGP